MFDDPDLTPQKQPKKPRDLSGLSIAELDQLAAELATERDRVLAEKTKKEAYQKTIGSLFKS
jgi:uncharacterized small protein (DUF1192 family)